MLSSTAAALAVAGLLAGATGSWSPCGLSMIDTLGATGHDRGRGTTLAACAAFALGATLGGIATFGGLAVLGWLLQDGGALLGPAVAIAVGAAALELLGLPIAPQIRRQVPEPWRRTLPLPIAGALYGVLLGMGFTTYVLSYAVPALATISVAVADPALGVVLGVAFGVGRALPIVALAPMAGGELGARALTRMAEHPGLLRGARLADAAALLACAALLAAPDALANVRVIPRATDPTASGDALAYQRPGGGGVLRGGGSAVALDGTHPALGGGRLALVRGGTIVVGRLGEANRTVPAPGADAVAVDRRWLAWRSGFPATLRVLDLADGLSVPRTIVRVSGTTTVSRPALDGDRLAYAVASRRGSRVRALDLRTGRTRTLRRARRVLLDQPALAGGALAYVRTSMLDQRLLLGRAVPRPTRRDRVLLRIGSTVRRDSGHEPGHTTQGRRPEDAHSRPRRPARSMLWSTALTRTSAFVTRLRPDSGRTDVLRVPR